MSESYPQPWANYARIEREMKALRARDAEARERGDAARAKTRELIAERDHLRRLFNRLEAAVTHHRRDCERNDVPDTHDEALWAARDRILRDSASVPAVADFDDADVDRLARFLQFGWHGWHETSASTEFVEQARLLLRFIFEGRRMAT